MLPDIVIPDGLLKYDETSIVEEYNSPKYVNFGLKSE